MSSQAVASTAPVSAPLPAPSVNPKIPLAILLPASREARQLFSGAVEHMRSRATHGDDYHISFTRLSANPYGSNLDIANIAEDGQTVLTTSARRPVLPDLKYNGVYPLFYRHSIPENRLPSWRFGRGSDTPALQPSRGVELLLCSPNDPLASQIAAVEFTLKVNPLSNLIILELGSIDAEVAIYVDGQWHALGSAPGVAKRCALYQRDTQIRIGADLFYHLKYVQTKTKAEFDAREVQRRWYFMTQLKATPPNINMWPVPPRAFSSLLHVKDITQIISYDIIKTWPNNALRIGLDVSTGIPLQIQETSIAGSASIRDQVMNEIAVLRHVKGKHGLPFVRQIWCQHPREQRSRNTNPCFDMADRVYIAFQLGYSTFAGFPFGTVESGVVKQLIRSVFKGLVSLKESRVIHGAITPHALVVVSRDMPYAIISGMAQAHQGRRSTNLALSTSSLKHFAAPELFRHNWEVFVHGQGYEGSADTWSLCVAIMASLGPLPIQAGIPITKETNAVLQRHILDWGNQNPTYEDLASVLHAGTNYYPRYRYEPEHMLELPPIWEETRKRRAEELNKRNA